MKNLLKLLILNLIIVMSSTSAIASGSIEEVIERDNSVVRITKKLKCLVCSGESIYDSNSNFSIAVREFVKNELERGQNEQEILDNLVNSYGEEILLAPFFSVKNLLLWILPFLLLVFGFYKLLSAQADNFR